MFYDINHMIVPSLIYVNLHPECMNCYPIKKNKIIRELRRDKEYEQLYVGVDELTIKANEKLTNQSLVGIKFADHDEICAIGLVQNDDIRILHQKYD